MVSPKNTAQCPRPGLELGQLDPVTGGLTKRPPGLPMYSNLEYIEKIENLSKKQVKRFREESL